MVVMYLPHYSLRDLAAKSFSSEDVRQFSSGPYASSDRGGGDLVHLKSEFDDMSEGSGTANLERDDDNTAPEEHPILQDPST